MGHFVVDYLKLQVVLVNGTLRCRLSEIVSSAGKWDTSL